MFLVIVCCAALFTTLQQRQYIATSSVLLDVKSTDPIAGSAMQALAISGYMATQADVILSERVVGRALRELKIPDDPETVSAWKDETQGQGDLMAWLYEKNLRRFEVLPSRESNVLTIAYTSADPKAAAAMVNTVVKAYIATTVELRVESAKQYNSFFDERARQLRVDLETAQTRLSAFQRDAGVVSNDERLDIENNRLVELSSQLVMAQTSATEAGSRKRLGTRNPNSSQEVLSSPVIAQLSTELARARARLNELRSRQGERNPDVATARATVSELQSRLTSETANIQTGLTINSDMYQQKATQLRSEVESQRTKVLKLKAQRDQAAVLQRDVDNANLAYSAAYTRVGQANMESQATQSNVSLLRVASVPGMPAKPRVLVNLAIAVVLGALFAVAFAIIREMRDQRLRTNEDVSFLLQQPMFGSLPKDTSRRSGKLSVSAAARRLTGPLPSRP